MMELQLFNNKEFGEIRALKINNEPWFVGKDAVIILSYDLTTGTSYTQYIKKHCHEEDVINYNKKTQVCYTLELDYKELGQRGGLLINEYALYDLILASPLPSAKKFKKWVTHEVLPQIRQTGGYIPYSQGESDEEFLARALIVAQNTLAKKNKMIEEMAPRIAYLDKIQGYGNGITTKTIAADYGMSSIKFNQLLHELHIQYKEGKMWHLYQEHKGNGYEIITYYKDKPHMKWTLKGAEWLYHILKDNGYIPIVEKEMKNN